jgi:acetyl-CoA carboxylase, biotin carboxylase subunit
MVHAGARDEAIDRLRRALDETEIAGIQTTLPFHRFVARDAGFRAADLSTGWVGEHWDGPAELRAAVRVAQLAAGLDALERGLVVAAVPSVAPASGDGAAGPTRWTRSGLEAAMDRWPR